MANLNKRGEYGEWIPGVLSKSQVKQLISDDLIVNTVQDSKAFDHSSMDLHVTDEGYLLPCGAIKPSGDRYLHGVKQATRAEPLVLNSGSFLLKRRQTYIFRLQEKLQLKSFLDEIGGVYGQATAKSSIGRVDVLSRLIVDGSRDYEMFTPPDFTDRNGTGDLYVEITPITFDVRVKPGISVNQLRFFLGSPSEAELRGGVLYRQVLRADGAVSDGSLSVDLSDSTIGGIKGAALVASSKSGVEIPLWSGPDIQPPNPCDCWKLLDADRVSKRLTIEMENFYILRSKERIALPKGVAVYCRASDETIGEMRIHYAGFVHPFFGYDRKDGSIGTPLIFEVRGHNVNVSLVDRERMAKLIFYRMSFDAEHDGEADKSYNDQELQVSKFFDKWPENLKRADDGSLSQASE